jgi:hypothetical protein
MRHANDDFDPPRHSGMPKWPFYVGGGLLLLLLLCGGGIVGAFFGARWLGSQMMANLPKPGDPFVKKEATDAEIVQAINDLRGPNRQQAADRLTGWKPAENRRKEVGQTLEPLLTDPNMFVAIAAAKALAVWGTADNLPALHRAIQSENFIVRKESLLALGEIKDPRSAGPIAQRLGDMLDREPAGKVLRALGPQAENEVVKCLSNQNVDVSLEACNILNDIGTKNAVPELQKVTGDKDPRVAAAARTAVNSINRR